ncbi:MAG: hypothetical protein K2H41_07825 [Acetatifactor sp.]|nr:hypothetical protein [Acetatifactor sp.]MDE7114479.1 hypothetical protein [Acetatifactor sp.]
MVENRKQRDIQSPCNSSACNIVRAIPTVAVGEDWDGLAGGLRLGVF